jgi:hypothetical protein
MNTSFKWRFFRAGGFDQVRIDSAAELIAIPSLDQKLWVALSCPTQCIDFDARTLALLDSDGDGHIRASDLIAAIQWVQARLKDPTILTQKLDGVPIDAIRTDDAEGVSIMEAALLLRANPEYAQGELLTVAATSAAKDAWLAQAIRNWEQVGEDLPPFGKNNSNTYTAFKAVSAKIDDYFLRCQWANFDPQARNALNAHAETSLSASANLLTDTTPLNQMPLAQISEKIALPLRNGINPAWSGALETMRTTVLIPLLGEQESLSLQQWQQIKEAFSPYANWLAQQPQKDTAHTGTVQLEKLARLVRDLNAFANNFVAFKDFYTRQGKAIFQTGTLYIDSRSCELCITVSDINKHASLASLSRMCLLYCECVRGSHKMTIAAAMTAGDSDQLMVGRNGVFYDHSGQDWDATIVKIIDHPISLRQSFWSPYKKLGQMVGSQLQKMAANKALDAEKKLASSATESIKIATPASAEKAAPAPAPFDVAKFAGIFAAIGLAIGAIGTAIASVLTGLFALSWWQIPLVLLAAVLAISCPSVLLAWLKLRHRNLGPLLDANGWAINARACINIPFGTALTHMAQLPPLAERSLTDPYAKPNSVLPYILAGGALICLCVLLWWHYF